MKIKNISSTKETPEAVTKIIIYVFSFFLTTFSFVQKSNGQTEIGTTDIETLPTSLEDIGGFYEEEDWFYFDNGIDSSISDNLFTTYKSDLHLTDYDSLVLISSHIDKQGMSHVLYAQLYKGIPIEGSMISTHGFGKSVNKINGSYGQNLDLDINPNISENFALTNALNIINAKAYAWEDSTLENDLQADAENPNTTYFPVGQLVITKGYAMNDTIYHLSWKFKITTSNPDFHTYTIYINAQDGSLVRLEDNSSYCNGIVGHSSTYYGTIYFDARQQGILGTIFTLEDCDRGDGIHTKKYDGTGTVNWSNTDESHGHSGDDDPEWQTGEIESAVAHWIVQGAYDCYLNQFGRVSFDGLGNRPLRVITESTGVTQSVLDPDSGDPSYLYIGYHPITSGSMARTDIIGHEYSHLFINFELSFMNGNAEAAAMNEGLADILGNYIESYITEDPYDYLLGEDVYTDRSMSDPTAYGDPDTYLGTYWDNVTYNTGTNSGPLRKMFYLLANGGTHPISGVTVTSIGVEDAMQIMYKAVEDNYLTDNSTYSSARTACINAAKDLYGDCSVQARQVARAFGAIGVGTATGNSIACVSITGVSPIGLCEEDPNQHDIVFTTQFLPSTATVNWTVPSGWTYSLSGTGNSICTITNVTDGTTKTITASVTTVKGTSTDSYTYYFQDCDEDGCPPLCKFESENPYYSGNYLIYPNPSTTNITIQSIGNVPLSSYIIYNTFGSVVKAGNVNSIFESVDISSLPRGFYMVKIMYSDKNELFKLTIE